MQSGSVDFGSLNPGMTEHERWKPTAGTGPRVRRSDALRRLIK